MSVFPIKSKDQHPQLISEANTDSLALQPVASPLQNLQHSITQTLLCGTTEVNRQFLGQDYNLLDKSPVTAYDVTPVRLLTSTLLLFITQSLEIIFRCSLKVSFMNTVFCFQGMIIIY